jgi:GAF domain-containing protein
VVPISTGDVLDEAIRLPSLSKHERAVANTLGWAEYAAAYGEFAEAIDWLDTLEAIGAEVPESYAHKRVSWAYASATRSALTAARTSLRVAEPAATRRMLALSESVEKASEPSVVIDRALEGAMALLGTDLGNVQISGPASRALTIATSSGFDDEFLEYFAIVDDDSSACGRAMEQRSQTVIADVDEDPDFAPHREIAASARFRAVQSTPIVDPSGRLHGMISTHFPKRHRPSPQDLQLMQWFGERVGAAMATRGTAASLL